MNQNEYVNIQQKKHKLDHFKFVWRYKLQKEIAGNFI